MSRILNYGKPNEIHEDDLCYQDELGDGHVALSDVLNHLELMANVPNGTGDALAARGAINAINVLAELAHVDASVLGVRVRA